MPRVRCLHDWELATDWDGDPNVINGTRSWKVARCRKCGDERSPNDVEVRDHEAGRADYYEDMRRDR